MGITVSGISQGAELTVLSANYSSQVQAVFALSGGDHFENIRIPLPCMDKANTMIPGNRLTIIDGQSDPYFGGQSNVQNVSGFVCPDGSFQCWSPDGSGAGWYIVQNWQNTTGTAGHCYLVDSTSVDVCAGIEDVNWRAPASYDWSGANKLFELRKSTGRWPHSAQRVTCAPCKKTSPSTAGVKTIARTSPPGPLSKRMAFGMSNGCFIAAPG
jgi:hypothetical protein